MQSTIATTCLVNVSEDVSEVVSLGITFDKTPPRSILEIEHKGQFNEVNEVLSFGTSTSMSEITSLKILSKNLRLNTGFCL